MEWFGISYDNGVVGIDKDERCINFCKLRCGSLADALLTDNEVDIDGLDWDNFWLVQLCSSLLPYIVTLVVCTKSNTNPIPQPLKLFFIGLKTK